MSSMLLTPVISEKAMGMNENGSTYVFAVPNDADKISIAQAVAQRFKVKVASVRTATIKGKPKQTSVQRGIKRVKGNRSDFKKAYVTLEAGQKIALFEGSK